MACERKKRPYVRRGLTLRRRDNRRFYDQEYNRLRKYGITTPQWEIVFESQGRRCAICRSKSPGRKRWGFWHTDHCHDKQQVRGILCHPCNVMLGCARDKPAILRVAVKYLSGKTEW